MPKAAPFEEHTERYEHWFDVHEHAYRSELEALSRLLPTPGLGIEIGVGSARFADPLGMRIGIDPIGRMLELAHERGIEVIKGVVGYLPFRDESSELLEALEVAGFSEFDFVQIIYRWLDKIDGPEPIEPGYGEGSFVTIRATQ